MIKQVNYKDDFSLALTAFKQHDYDAEMLIHKFDEISSTMGDSSEQTLSEIKSLIMAAELPAELSEQLSNAVSDLKTRVFVSSPESEAEDSKVHIDSHSSSLLNELLKWKKGDEKKEIQAGQTIRDTYRLVSRIGKGGMGEVWKAIDLIQDAGDSKDKYVAIKFVNHEIRSHPFALKALVREFARYKKLIHRNIVKAYELNRDESEVFIVMEYLDGISLKEFIKQHPDGISLNDAKPIIGGMCKALNYAHSEGIIHLDFKPGNVFYNTETQKTKVIDFGIARLSKQADRDKTRFDPGNLGAVSTAYASIEMLLMDDDPDPRDDIYGLACVVYELLSGKHVFNGAIATKAERDKMHPEPLKRLKNTEFKAILKGLNFDRNERTPIAEQFFQDLYLPQISAKRKRTRWLILTPILLLTIILTPLLINKGYDYQKKNQIIAEISKKQLKGIEKFQALSIEEQSRLLFDEEILLSLIQFSTNYSLTGKDAIEFLSGFKPEVQTLVFKNQDVRESLIHHYTNNINEALLADDFDQAVVLSRTIIEKYPDSKNLSDQMENVLSWKIKRLSELEENYHQCIIDNSKSLIELKPCLQASITLLRKIAPQHKILMGQELSARYQLEISTALQNRKFSHAENLLADWYAMNNADIPLRKELENTLKYQQQLVNISKQITDSNDNQMQDLISNLIKLDTRTRTDVLSQTVVQQKVMNYFNQVVFVEIKAKKYAVAFKHVETAFALFSDMKNQQQPLQQLNSKIHEYKNHYLEDLARNYKVLLASDELDVKALQNLQRQIASIEPEHPLLEYPGVSKLFFRRIDQAISNEQFDLMDVYFENWKLLKPADAQSKEFLDLSKKYKQQLNNHEKRIHIEKRMLDALQSDQTVALNTVLKDLQSNFSTDQKQRVINKLKTPLISFYQKQIRAAIQHDEFNRANDIINDAMALIPEEKSQIISKQQLKKEKNRRIKALLNSYQLTLDSDAADGKQIFSNLLALRKIDSQYLEKNQYLYQKLKSHLLNLAKDKQALAKLQDITTQWDKFFNGMENSEKARKTYKDTRNQIALRCLYTGRQLIQQGKQESGIEFLMFGLSLEPVHSVQRALTKELEKKELEKTIIPGANKE